MPDLSGTAPRHGAGEAAVEIIVNGETTRVAEDLTLLALVRQRDLDPDVVVVERNRSIVPAGTFADVRLEPGDSLEIVHFVGGG